MLPRKVEHRSLMVLREKLIKIGAKVVRHARHVFVQQQEDTIWPQAPSERSRGTNEAEMWGGRVPNHGICKGNIRTGRYSGLGRLVTHRSLDIRLRILPSHFRMHLRDLPLKREGPFKLVYLSDITGGRALRVVMLLPAP